MSRVLPWPTRGEPGYVGLHWASPNIPRPALSQPFRTLDDFMEVANQAAVNDEYYKEVYYCLSLQEKTRQSSSGRISADRRGRP
jgi:hypothetical protein